MDFENYTELSQFDMDKVYRFIKLESIPSFKMYESEKKYLAKYREVAAQHSDEIGFNFDCTDYVGSDSVPTEEVEPSNDDEEKNITSTASTTSTTKKSKKSKTTEE